MTTATLSYMNWKVISIIGFCVIVMLSFLYVWQIVSLTSGSYVFDKFQKQVDQLSQDNKNLQVSFAESSFLSEVLQKAQELNFKKIVSVKYIQVPDKAFAVAK